eukprot:1693888-Pyramimonas_sp.AAC.1
MSPSSDRHPGHKQLATSPPLLVNSPPSAATQPPTLANSPLTVAETKRCAATRMYPRVEEGSTLHNMLRTIT